MANYGRKKKIKPGDVIYNRSYDNFCFITKVTTEENGQFKYSGPCLYVSGPYDQFGFFWDEAYKDETVLMSISTHFAKAIENYANGKNEIERLNFEGGPEEGYWDAELLEVELERRWDEYCEMVESLHKLI